MGSAQRIAKRIFNQLPKDFGAGSICLGNGQSPVTFGAGFRGGRCDARLSLAKRHG